MHQSQLTVYRILALGIQTCEALSLLFSPCLNITLLVQILTCTFPFPITKATASIPSSSVSLECFAASRDLIWSYSTLGH